MGELSEPQVGLIYAGKQFKLLPARGTGTIGRRNIPRPNRPETVPRSKKKKRYLMVSLAGRHPELSPNEDFVRIRKRMLGPTKGCGAYSREQKRNHLANERSVSHKIYITLCAL